MQLQPRSPALRASDDLATALSVAADALGHRPAVTVLRTERRDEQGFASLRQWAAKTAHWLTIEHGLGVGDRLALVGPPGWVPVAACLGAWWAGVTVALGDDADVALVHEDASAPAVAEAVGWGGAVDGSPTRPGAFEPFALAVQTFPDQPPPPAAAGELPALWSDGRSWTHAELLAAARRFPDGTLGLDVGSAEGPGWVPALAVHPLTAGRPTVLVDGVGRDAAAGERVDSWLSPRDLLALSPDQAGPPS